MPRTPVNDHPTLTHEQVLEAIRIGSAPAMRRYAVQADEAGAHALAADLRRYAELAEDAPRPDSLAPAPAIDWRIEPAGIPGRWLVMRDGVAVKDPHRPPALLLLPSAQAARDWIDGLGEPAPVVSMDRDALRAELARLNDERRDDERRTAICQELTLRMIADELPDDWSVWHDERVGGWAVSRDHGALVVGVGYRTLAQAFDVARRTLAADEA